MQNQIALYPLETIHKKLNELKSKINFQKSLGESISVERDIIVLKKSNWIEFRGCKKKGYYTLTEEGKTATSINI